MSQTFAYVSNADSGELTVLALDERRGRLESIQSLPLGGMLMPIALRPDRRVLYVARRSDPLGVVACAIDPATGRLAKIGEAPLPDSMAYVSVDETGRWLFSASYGGNVVAVSALDAQGLPQPAHQVIATPPKAHCIRALPGNRHVLATSLGGGQVLQFAFDAKAGRLTPNDPSSIALRTESGPRHLAFHPQAPWAVLLNELDATLDVLAIDRERGTLTPRHTSATMPPGPAGEPWAAELRFTPDGRHLYTSERRSSTLAVHRFDAATGQASLVGHVPTKAQPRGFAVSPSGRYLIAAGQASHRVSLHAVDADSGNLCLVGEHAVGQNPNWVEMLELP